MPSRSRPELYLDGKMTDPQFDRAVEELATSVYPGLPPSALKVVRASALCRLGVPTDLVSRHLGWRDFEGLCGSLLQASGYAVRTNLMLKKPRAQIDVLAKSPTSALVVDCKHWKRSAGPSTLARVVEAQADRAERLRAVEPGLPPMTVVVLSLGEQPTKFVAGGAVVPVHALSDFSANLLSYSGYLSAK